MKTWKNPALIGLVAMVAIFALAFIGCDTPSSPSPAPLAAVTPPPPALSEEATITLENYELTATYDGDEEVSYQWYKDGVAIEGATDATYIPIADGSYTVTVSAEGYASQTSDPIVVTLETLEGELNVSPNTDVTTGVELTATYTGSEGVISYQWKKGETNVGTNSNKFTPTEYGIYTVTVSLKGYNGITSDEVTIIGVLAGTISITPNSSVTTYTELTATYTGSEDGVISYQWKKDGANVGTNSDKFTPTEAGSYTVTVSLANYDSKTSTSVTISLPSLAGEINITPSGQEIPIGTELIATYTGSEIVSYQWKKDGTNVGTNSNKFTSTEVGNYTVTVSSAGYTEKTSSAVNVAPIFNTIEALVAYLAVQPTNTVATSYAVKLNIASLPTGSALSSSYSDLQKALMVANKYVNLDLSDSTFTSIGDIAFDNCTSLTGITIPDGVTSIGYIAFRWCSSLASITIPNGVTSIGLGAFFGCSSLTNVTIPNTVTSIDGVFQDCTSLTSITIPNSVTNIAGAFDGCRSLASITIPNSVTNIGGAFRYCRSLTGITIPNSVTNIDGAFYECTSLTNVIIPDSVTSIGDDTFYECNNLPSITIPNSVTSIGNRAFRGCRSLASITIPASVTTIGSYAFHDCISLASVTFLGTIASDNIRGSFPGDTRYLADGVGTYTRIIDPNNTNTPWTKQ